MGDRLESNAASWAWCLVAGRVEGRFEFRLLAGVGRERLVRYGMKKTRIADIWLRNRLRGKKPSKSEEKVEPDRCFRVSLISFESRNLLMTLVRTQSAEVLNFVPPDARIMKQKLLNPPGDSEGQARVEALRVALNS
jgi:hypothetical protein